MIADPQDLVTGVANRTADGQVAAAAVARYPRRQGEGSPGLGHLQSRADHRQQWHAYRLTRGWRVMDGGGVITAGTADPTARTDRLALLAFVADVQTENVLREGLSQALPGGVDIRRGNVRTALATLSHMPTPRALVIDITGEQQPLGLLGDLSHILEPDVQVMIVGDREDVAFYRQVTRTLGATEYLYKPLVPDMVARHFAPQITRQGPSNVALGGRMVTVTGVRGGVGATTVAANLAWLLADEGRRHTALLDADLQTGTAALLLGAQGSSGLRSALEQPARVDELFIERVATPLGERLHVLAGEEALADQPICASGAVERLAGLLRRRFNIVVADVPFRPGALSRDLLDLTQQRVLVSLPTLAGVRDMLRMLALPSGNAQARRAVVVLNRAGMPGGLSRKQMEAALGLSIDVVIPDLPRPLGLAERLGDPAAKAHGPFRAAMSELVREVAFASTLSQPKRRKWVPW